MTAKILDIITRTTFGFFKQSLNSVQLNGGVSYFVLRALNMIKVVIIEASLDKESIQFSFELAYALKGKFTRVSSDPSEGL